MITYYKYDNSNWFNTIQNSAALEQEFANVDLLSETDDSLYKIYSYSADKSVLNFAG